MLAFKAPQVKNIPEGKGVPMAWLVVCYAKTQPKASKASTAPRLQTPINE